MKATTAMECRRAEELLSDQLEGGLEEPLLSELQAHLDGCSSCRELRDALAEVVEALKAYPVLDAPTGLAARAAEAALRAPRAAAAPRRPSQPFRLVPSAVHAIAASLALVVTGLVLAALANGGPWRTATRVKDRAVNAGVYLVERKERLVEDFRILRVVVGTAFGSRMDRLGDRVEDYRRLLERRKTNETEPKKTNGTRSEEPDARLVARPTFQNIRCARLVTSGDDVI